MGIMLPKGQGKFEVVQVVPGETLWKNSIVDLRLIDDAAAEKLVAEGYPYLSEVTVKKSAADVGADKKISAEKKVD